MPLPFQLIPAAVLLFGIGALVLNGVMNRHELKRLRKAGWRGPR